MDPNMECLVIASTGQHGPVLYKGDKGFNDPVRPSDGGLAETESLSASNLPLLDNAPTRMPDNPAKMPIGGKANSKLNAVTLSPGARTVICLCFPPDKTCHKVKWSEGQIILDNEGQCYTRVPKVPIMQLTHLKVADWSRGSFGLKSVFFR